MTVPPRGEYELEAPTAVIASYLRKTISISYLIGLVWSGKWVIAACAALGFLYSLSPLFGNGSSRTTA